MNSKPIDANLMLKMFIYKDGCLLNKTTRGPAISGARAGNINSISGYWMLMVNKVNYRQHRIIYAMFNGDVGADLCIDHIDGDRANNRIENLRAASHDENIRNRKDKVKSKNKTGLLGVYKIKKSTVNPYYSSIRFNGSSIYLGAYPSIDLASCAYQQARVKYFGKFA